jgi:hypothetical protein
MPAAMHAVPSFPSVRLPSLGGGVPVDIALIAQLGVGAGDEMIRGVLARQRAHDAFVDALDEPSARIGGMDLANGDATSLYTFGVGSNGHPFHRHAGHRVFTAVSGSAGAQLRFSTASQQQLDADPQAFVDALRHVAIPPDSLFTVRFGGGTWHQFLPLLPGSRSPALFALSCHTNELGGDLPAALRAKVEADDGDIASLTEVLPEHLADLLRRLAPASVPTTTLSLHAAPASAMARLCAVTRRIVGPLRSGIGGLWPSGGFLHEHPARRDVRGMDVPPDSLLRAQFAGVPVHEDMSAVHLRAADVDGVSAEALLAAVLDGFLQKRSATVSGLMTLRNVLVRPLRLRTSPLGCPVSSLLSPCNASSFSGRFPVLAQHVASDRRLAEVILGADDRHLRFRSSVRVVLADDGGAVISLGTRVRTLNAFGRAYMAAIGHVHRRYITPTMLRLAVEHALDARRALGMVMQPA